MAKLLSENEKSLQKKFIPGNIIICIIALVTGICLLLMPFLDVRIHVSGSKISTLLSATEGESADNSETEAFSTMLSQSLEGIELDVPINIYPLKLLKAAIGTEDDVADFMSSVIGKNGASDILEEVTSSVAPAIAKSALKSSIELDDKYDTQVDSIIKNLSNGSNEDVAQARSEFNDLVNQIALDNGDEAPDTAEMEEMFDTIVEQGTKEDGEFDFVHFITNMNVDEMNGSDSSSTDGDTADGATDETTESDNPISSLVKILDDPASLFADLLAEDQEMTQTLQTAFLALFVVFVGLPALLCLLLVLCSFIRLFTKRKRVRYWYVKVILFISTIIIVALNVLSKVLLPSLDLGAEVGDIISAFSLTFLGSGVVCAVCWLLLTIVSLFYYRRIKKKVKKLRKSQNALANE